MASSSTTESRSHRAARRAGAALSRASRRAMMAAAVALGATFLMHANAGAAPAVGQKAPDFVAVDTSGKPHRLSDFTGKYVVLEWTNPGCPFVRKHYNSGNMPATQKAATAKGVVWLAVNSTERARERLPAARRARHLDEGPERRPDRDADGRGRRDRPGLRRAHHAAHVHHRSARRADLCRRIDSMPSAEPADIKTATNYVNQALGEAFGGKPVSAAATRAYGCSIKYKG